MRKTRWLWIIPESFSLLALVFWGVFLAWNAGSGLLSGGGAWERLWAVTAGMGAVYLFLGWGALCPGYFWGRRLFRLPPPAREPGCRALRLGLCSWKGCLLWGWTGGFWLRAWGTGLEGWLWLGLGLLAVGILAGLALPWIRWMRRGKPENDSIWKC